MRLALVPTLLAACTAGPDRDRDREPPRATSPAPTTTASVHIEVPRGLRDLVAVVDPPGARLSWRVDGEPSPVTSEIVPARDLVPGTEWTVTATWPGGTAASASATVPEPPGGNVLVLLLDDVGIDHVGAYGVNPAAPPTPRMDALAAEGVRFERAYASPVCSPTRGILLTGRHARRTGLGWIADTGTRDYALPLESLTIAEALDHARTGPWATTALGKWHVAGPAYPGILDHPLDQGFDHYAGSPGNPKYAEGYGYWVWDKNVDGVVEVSTTYMTTDTVDDALARIDELPEPWFLYVAFNAAHTPLSPPPPELTTLDVDDASTEDELFDATVEALDTELGRLFDGMDPWVRARTTIALVGDNGTPDHAIDPPIDPSHGKHYVYEPGVRVPFLVAGPHVAVPGSVSEVLVHVADVMPTVLELAGVPLGGPDDALFVDVDPPVALDGRSLLPQLEDTTAPGRTLLYVEAFSPNGPSDSTSLDRRMVRDERYKVLRHGSVEELFDLTTDPLGFDDGPNLLDGPLDADAEAAWTRLGAELDAIEATLTFEGY